MEYLDITTSTVFSGFVGLIAPFLFPFLFKLFGKIVKREVTEQERRMLIVIVSLLISVGVVAYHFEWGGGFIERAWAFILYLGVNFVTLRGVIQSIYELIIKNIPSIEARIAKIEEIK